MGRGLVTNRHARELTREWYTAKIHNLNPELAPVRTLADMGPDEIAALEEKYGCRVKGAQ